MKAVVSLPREAFAISGTVAKTSFVCLQKKISPVENHEPVFMAVADHIGYLKKGTTEIPDPAGNDLVAIAAAYEALTRKDIPPIVGELNQQPAMVLVPEQDLEANLVPQSYHADRLRARSAVLELGPHCCYVGDLAAVQKPKQAMHSERTCYFISVLHLDEKSNVDWAAAAAHAPQSKGLICQPGEVLYSCINPAKVRVTVIPEDLSGEILCSTEFAILRAKDGVDPYYLALALKGETSSRQIEPLARGTSSSRRRIQECDLLNVVLPYPDATTRQDLAARFRDALEQARKAAVLNRDTLRSLNRLLPSKESTATS